MASTKISALAAASALDGTEPFPCVQSSATKKATGAQIKDYILGQANTWTAIQSNAAGINSYWYNTADQTTNFERGFFRFVSNILEIGFEKGGTGNERELKLYAGAGQSVTLKSGGSTSFQASATSAICNVPLTPVGGIAAAGGLSAAPRNVHTGGIPVQVNTDGTNLDIVVTELYVAEVFIPSNMTVTGVSVFNSTNTNGNSKVMLFDSAGTRVAISVSTDVSAFVADTYNRIPFSAPYAAKGPATYYVGVICDTNTHDLNTHTFGDFGAGKITGLVYGTEAGYATITVPTTFTTGLGPIASLY